MTEDDFERQSPSEISREYVIWASDPLKSESDAARPLIVLNNETHPFDGEQWIAAAVSTTPRPQALELTDEAWIDGTLPQCSYAYPWAVLSPRIERVDYVVGRTTEPFVDEIVAEAHGYVEA